MILALVSVCIVLVPIAAALGIYSNNMAGLIIPSNVNKLVKAPQNSQGFLPMPQFVGAQYNTTSQTLSLILNITNTFWSPLTINALSGELSDNQTGYSLGYLSLSNPVNVEPNETALITLTATFNQGAANDVVSAYAGNQSLNVDLSNVSITIDGLTLQMNQAGGTMNVALGN